MTTDELVDWCFYQSGSFLVIPKADFHELMQQWDVQEVVLNGSFAGAIVRQEREIHIHISKHAALYMFRRFLREYIQPLLGNLEFLTTTTLPNTAAVVFLERCGFYKTYEDTETVKFRLDKLKIH